MLIDRMNGRMKETYLVVLILRIFKNTWEQDVLKICSQIQARICFGLNASNVWGYEFKVFSLSIWMRTVIIRSAKQRDIVISKE